MIISLDDHLVLETTSVKFADKLFDVIHNNRAHLSAFLPWVEHMLSIADVREYLQKCEQLEAEDKERSFVILVKDSPVGRIGLHHINAPNKTASIGYWLDKNVEGRGIISKACKKLIQFGFEEMGLHRIEIKAAVKNLRSQAIPEKLHFKKEGRLREAEFVNNEFIDLFLYSLLKPDYQNGMSVAERG